MKKIISLFRVLPAIVTLKEVIIFYKTGYGTGAPLSLSAFGSCWTTPVLIPSNSMELKTRQGQTAFHLLQKDG